jgi:hypothetical protein
MSEVGDASDRRCRHRTGYTSCPPRCTRGLCQRRYEAERDFVCGLYETASEEGS